MSNFVKCSVADLAEAIFAYVDDAQLKGDDGLRKAVEDMLRKADSDQQTFTATLVGLLCLLHGSPRFEGGQQEWREWTEDLRFAADVIADVHIVGRVYAFLGGHVNDSRQRLPNFVETLRGRGLNYRPLGRITTALFFLQQQGHVSGLAAQIQQIDQDAVLENLLPVITEMNWAANGAFVCEGGDRLRPVSGTGSFRVDEASVLAGNLKAGSVIVGRKTDDGAVSDVVALFTELNGDVERACSGQAALLVGFWRNSPARYQVGAVEATSATTVSSVSTSGRAAAPELLPHIPDVPESMLNMDPLLTAHQTAQILADEIAGHDEVQAEREPLEQQIDELERQEAEFELRMAEIQRQLSEASATRQEAQKQLAQLPLLDDFDRAGRLQELKGLVMTLNQAVQFAEQLSALPSPTVNSGSSE